MRHPSLSAARTMNLPYQDHSDSKLKGYEHTYDIGARIWRDKDLSVYVAHYQKDYFEAQAFEKYRLPPKVYLARKRRIQRLKRSINFVEEIESDESKFIISRIPVDGIERHGRGQSAVRETGTNHDLSAENYPPLCTPPVSHRMCPDGMHPQFAEAVSSHPTRETEMGGKDHQQTPRRRASVS
ncbi:uncharacterized protein F4822DRAFT_167118 [Hypoxylon trugodes]|uniref:uncharacterized protein n=1 Tax=Hypoxylon trugodes TaxID=326681 RepID=UPI002196BE4E|nr:uncharacterized protein F4822DRAFT_167118 [Hypoxylon trugodes]KAI1390925.1 hypothetical protein F4822DRAFT_167118 [Hypoxylon trugodes]